MPSSDSPHLIIARFLKSNGFQQTLDSFLQEIGLDEEEAAKPGDGMTLEAILEERRMFSVSPEYELVQEGQEEETLPYPCVPQLLEGIGSNVLFITVVNANEIPYIVTACADRTLCIHHGETLKLTRVLSDLHPSPILSVMEDNGFLVTAGMDGCVHVVNFETGSVHRTLKQHDKYAVHLKTSSKHLVTAGYDKRIHVYGPRGDTWLGTIELSSNPEALLLTEADQKDVLIVSKRDSTFLYYYDLANLPNPLRQYNLAEQGSWVSFCCGDIARSPTHPQQYGVVTTSAPTMRFLYLDHSSVEPNVVQNARTGAPQDHYSSPRCCFRPSGDAVWVNSDDGVIRAINIQTGKIDVELKKHDGRVKALWAGMLHGKEVLLSGGMADSSVCVWKA